jgi:hypothetical protein
MMSFPTVKRLYDNLIGQGKEPKVVMCNRRMVGQLIAELHHSHIPVHTIRVDDRATDTQVGFSMLDPADDMIPELAEWYIEYKVILPPDTETWKKHGFNPPMEIPV